MQAPSNTLLFPRSQQTALVVGVAGLAVGVLLALIAGSDFFESYLYAFLFWIGLPLGCLVLLLTNHLAGGPWGALIQRPLEAGASLLPLMALFFIPLVFATGGLYLWTDAVYLEAHPSVAWKSWYLNTPFWIVRAAIYFLTWILIARSYLRNSAQQDEDAADGGRLGYQMKSRAGLSIIMYVMTMTLAAVDWGMSLTPVWWSGIYGVIFMISQAITAIAFIIGVMAIVAARNERVNALLTAKRLQDLGNFLMAFTVFWAYTSISQLIILWSNNVVETNTWYVLRFGPGWSIVGAVPALLRLLRPLPGPAVTLGQAQTQGAGTGVDVGHRSAAHQHVLLHHPHLRAQRLRLAAARYHPHRRHRRPGAVLLPPFAGLAARPSGERPSVGKRGGPLACPNRPDNTSSAPR